MEASAILRDSKARILDLPRASLTAQLHHKFTDLPKASCTDRMPFRFQSTGWIDGNATSQSRLAPLRDEPALSEIAET